MMPKVIKLLAEASQQLQAQLLTDHQHFIQQQNPDALHQLRISLRQLRSLLRPLRANFEEAMTLDRLVQHVMASTNPIRDREVLILELQQQQMPELTPHYQEEIAAAYLQVAQQPELEAIHQGLCDVSLGWKSVSAHTAHHLEKHIRQQWQLYTQKLLKLMQHDLQDKHRIRVLIKHLRYSSETYQAVLPQSASTQIQALKDLQAVLGKWHDYLIFLAFAQQQPELQVLIPIWQQQLQHWEHKSDHGLKQFKRGRKITA